MTSRVGVLTFEVQNTPSRKYTPYFIKTNENMQRYSLNVSFRQYFILTAQINQFVMESINL